MPRMLTMLSCSLLVLLPGCSTFGPDPAGQEQITSLVVDDAAFAELGLRRDWTGFPVIGDRQQIREVYADPSTVVVQETGSTVSALDPATGALRWHDRMGSPLTRYISLRPITYRGVPSILVSSESELFIHQADTGNLLARQSLAKVVNTGPVINGNLAIYGTASGEIMAHAIVPGVRVWGHDLEGPIETGPTWVRGAVVAVSDSGQLASVSADTGALFGRGRMFDGTTTDPVAGDQLLFVASLDQSVWAFDPFDPARPVWRFQTPAPLTMQPTVHAGMLYVATSDRGLVALDQATGRVVWENPEVRGEVIALQRDRLLVFHEGQAWTVSPTSGVVYDHAVLPTVAGMTTDRFVDGSIYVWGSGGGVAKFRARF